MFKKLSAGLFALPASFIVFSGNALAQQASWDTTAVTQEVTNARAPVIAVGVAVLGIAGLILGYRMIRRITG